MKCIEFEGQNLMLNPPKEMSRGTCGDLPACVTPDGRMISVWKPSASDLAALNAGDHVLLHVWGQVHPPVAITVQKMVEMP